jgi:hypothetical protein
MTEDTSAYREPLYLVVTRPCNMKWRNGEVVIARGPGVPAEPGDLFMVPADSAPRFAVEFMGHRDSGFRFVSRQTFEELRAVQEAVHDEYRQQLEWAARDAAQAAEAEAQRVKDREELEGLVREAARSSSRRGNG